MQFCFVYKEVEAPLKDPLAVALAVKMDRTEGLNLFRKYETKYICRRVKFNIPCDPRNFAARGVEPTVIEMEVTAAEKQPKRRCVNSDETIMNIYHREVYQIEKNQHRSSDNPDDNSMSFV